MENMPTDNTHKAIAFDPDLGKMYHFATSECVLVAAPIDCN